MLMLMKLLQNRQKGVVRRKEVTNSSLTRKEELCDTDDDRVDRKGN